MNFSYNKALKSLAKLMSFILITLGVIGGGVTALASDESSVNGSYYESRNLVRVFSDMNTKYANAPVTVWILKDGALYYAYQTEAAADGSIEFTFNLTQDISYDDFCNGYTLKVNLKGETKTITPAEGKEIEITQLDWNVDSKMLTVYGISLVEGDLSLAITNPTDDVIAQQTATVNNGRFTFVVSMEGESYGKYFVKVSTSDASVADEREFVYKSPQNVIDELLTDATGTNYSNVLKNLENLKALGVASWVNSEGIGFMDLEANVYEIMSKHASTLTKAEDITDAAEKASLINALNTEDNPEVVMFDTYKSIMNETKYPLVKAYKDLTQDQKTVLLNAVSKKGIESFKKFDETMANNVLVPLINEKEISSTLANLVESYPQYFAIKGTLTSAEYRTVIEGRPYTTITGFVSRCNAIIDARDNSSGSSGSGSSNSGGGGGGAGGGGKPSLTNPIKKEETDLGSKRVDTQSKPEEKVVFNDLSDAIWAKDAIEALYKKGIISGYGDGRFNPSGTVKREEFVKMLVCAINLKLDSEGMHFGDTKEGEWYNSYINAAYLAGITAGKPDGTFGIGENVTRQDAAVLCYRSFDKLKQIQVKSKDGFKDEGKISPYALESVQKLHSLGIINGMEDNKFKPADVCTRAQAAQMIYTILVYSEGGLADEI